MLNERLTKEYLNPDLSVPWMDFRLPEDAMEHLRNAKTVLELGEEDDANSDLAGNISNSKYIQDKDNWFYDNILKECVEYLYFRESWSNYFECVVANSRSVPLFSLRELWVNYQKQHEFNPAHYHMDGGGFSFVVFLKIPTHWKEQHALPISANSNSPVASDFAFLSGTKDLQTQQGMGPVIVKNFPLCPEDEGRILFFPAWLSHQVFPFYGTDKKRITISGNIAFQEEETKKR